MKPFEVWGGGRSGVFFSARAQPEEGGVCDGAKAPPPGLGGGGFRG